MGPASSEEFLDSVFGEKDWRKHHQQENLQNISLEELQARADSLTEVKGDDQWMNSNPEILSYLPETIIRKAQEIDEMLGQGSWRDNGFKIIGVDVDRLEERVGILDDLFGNRNWDSNPLLLIRDHEALVRRASELTAIIGAEQWKKQPSLLGQDPETIRERFQLLSSLVGGDERARAGAGVLTLSNDSLVSKAAFLTSTFKSESWRRSPTLLGYSEEHVLQRCEIADAFFGNKKWRRNNPSVITNSEERLAEKGTTLDNVLGSDVWKKHPSLLNYPPETIEIYADEYDEIIGNPHWRKQYPQILMRNPDAIRQNAAEMDQLYGSKKWAKHPSILGQSAEGLRAKAQAIHQRFGRELWKKIPNILIPATETLFRYADNHTKVLGSDYWLDQKPGLMKSPPRTVNSSLRALRSIGITPETHRSAILNLLDTTVKLKREKIEIIRTDILGHRQIHAFSEKVPLHEYVDYKASLTQAEIDEEEAELKELANYMEGHATLLYKSKAGLKKHATNLKEGTKGQEKSE